MRGGSIIKQLAIAEAQRRAREQVTGSAGSVTAPPVCHAACNKAAPPPHIAPWGSLRRWWATVTGRR